MTSLDKIEQGRAATTSGGHFAVELTETLRLAVPIALTQLGQIAMMTIDLALIGRLGDEAVAAAALANTVFFVSFNWCPPWRRSSRRRSAPEIPGRCGVRFGSDFGPHC